MSTSKVKKFKFDFWNVVTIGIFLIFAVSLIYPLFSLFASSLKDSATGEFTLSNFVQFFSKKYYYQSLGRSFSVTICTTILTILIGVPLAYIMTTSKIRGKGLIEILIIISVLSPPFIGAYSWILLLGRSGVVTQFLSKTFGFNMPSIYGFAGILLVFTLKLFPFIYMYTTGALKKLDVSLIEASESLGCTGIKKVFTVVIPLILPTVLAGSLLVFITTIIFLGQKYVVNKKSFVMSSLKPIQPKKLTGIKNILAHLFVYVTVGLAVIPQVTVIYTSFLKTRGPLFLREFSLNSYTNVIGKLGGSIRNTFVYGVIAIILIIVLGMFISYVSVRRKNMVTSCLDTLTMFPYIIPGSVLGITLLLAFNKKPLLLSGTFIIIVIAYVIRRLPYTIRSSAAILYQISPSMEEASISLGYSQFQTFKNVTSRMMLPGVISGAILSWITVINELSASIILYTGKTRTMSVAIYSEVIRASYGTAAALSAILTFTTIISLLIFFKLSASKEISL